MDNKYYLTPEDYESLKKVVDCANKYSENGDIYIYYDRNLIFKSKSSGFPKQLVQKIKNNLPNNSYEFYCPNKSKANVAVRIFDHNLTFYLVWENLTT